MPLPPIVGIELVVAGRDAAELLQLADQPLDEIPAAIHIAIEIGVRGRVGAAWDDRYDALAAEHAKQPGRRVRLDEHGRGTAVGEGGLVKFVADLEAAQGSPWRMPGAAS